MTLSAGALAAYRLQGVLKPHRRRAGLERLLLALMRGPAGEPNEIESRAQAPIGVRETFGIDRCGARQHVAAQKTPAPRDKRIGRAHAAQVSYQRDHIVIANDDAIKIDHRQPKAGALQQCAEGPDVRKGRDARRSAAERLTLGREQRLAQFGQRVAASKAAEKEAVRLERAADLYQQAGQIVDGLQREE